MIIYIIEGLIGFAGGVAVGAGFVAFLTILKVIPRLIQISQLASKIKLLIGCIILGALFGALLTFSDLHWQWPIILLSFWGLLQGIFVGMLAGALTEVLNVFPILSRRIHMTKYLYGLLSAIAIGKISGSLFQWLIMVK